MSLSEPAVQRVLGDAYGDGERVLIASSMPIRDAEAFLAGGDAAVTIHANRGANGIDGLLSTAAGIAAGADAPTWIVLGDLALAHDLGGLAAVAAAGQPLRIVVVDNGGGGIFDFLPQAGSGRAGPVLGAVLDALGTRRRKRGRRLRDRLRADRRRGGPVGARGPRPRPRPRPARA